MKLPTQGRKIADSRANWLGDRGTRALSRRVVPPIIPPRPLSLLLLPIAAAVSSCGLFYQRPPLRAARVMHEWDDDRGPGEVSVEIDLSSQTATYQRGGRPIGWSFVSTGKEGHDTSHGSW